MTSQSGGRRFIWIGVGALVIADVAAYVITRVSLAHEDFDGLNNLQQLVLGLPWTLTPRGTDHVLNAAIDLACGLLNVALIAGIVRWRQRTAERS